jgi:muramidase (phage lysozyme)
VVQCESGGQNLPPNWATASGYYQIIIPTWKAFGGPTAQAYQASKAVQDAIASRIWDGGAGANNWDCFRLLHTGHL